MNKDRKAVIVLSFSIIIALLDLVFLYFIKYRNQHLSFLRNFDFFYIGNLINLLFSLILILGLLILLFKRGVYANTKHVRSFIIIINFFLLIAAIISSAHIAPTDYYIFHEPAEKIIEGLFYLLFQLAEFAFIVFIWLNIKRKKKFILLESILNALALFLFIMIAVFVFELFAPIKEDMTPEQLSAVDKNNDNIAVVLGAAVWPKNKPSPSLKGRLDKAFQLYVQGTVNKIQLTGGNAPGELTEARVGYNYLVNKGVLPRSLMLEEKTSSTSEQISFIKTKLMDKNNHYNIFVVSDAFHLPRVLEICKFYNIKVNVVPSGIKLFNDIDINAREIVALTFFWLFAV